MRIDISKSGYHIDVENKRNTNFAPINKSGGSLINYRRRLKESDSLQIRTPYIANGFNNNNILTNFQYNDNKTINFNVNNTDLSYLLSDNEILNINELKASPSTFPTINPGFTSSNIDLIENFSKYSNVTSTKYKKFKDHEYIENNTINYDLINGENQYNFLDSNLFEQISIDIELDNPNEVYLQNSAFIQGSEFSSNTLDTLQPDDNIVSTYTFSQRNISNYDFRKTVKEYSRLNTPFVMYNFTNQCWEYRGIPNPYQYFSDENNMDIYADNFENPAFSKYLAQFDNSDNTQLGLSTQNFGNFFNKYFINELCLTNNPINYLPVNDTTIDYTSNLSLPSSLFGFPHFEKFHMFNDNILKMSNYINKPMIIDKVTVSLNVDVQSEINSQLHFIELRNGLAASLNFYILNQYKLPNTSSFNITQPMSNNSVDSEFGFEKLIDVFTNSYTNFKHDVKKAMLDNPTQFALFDCKDKPINALSNDVRSNYKLINRILNHENLIYNNLINSDYVNDELVINDNIKYDYNQPNGLTKLNTDLTSFYQKNKNFHNSYLREIVTFGNVIFYSQGNTAGNNNDKTEIYTPSSIDLIKNNCDYFINTDIFDTYPQYSLPASQINYLDFSSATNNLPIKFTTYLKKPSNIENILNESVGLSSHNINRQFELYDNLNFFKFTEKSKNINNEWFEIYKKNKLNRTMSNAINTRSLINENSDLLSLNAIQKIKSKQLNNLANNHINQVIDNYNLDSSILEQSGSINIEKSSHFSPYIITPDNDLGFVFSFSPTLLPGIFKQVITLKKGKIKFTLHGHILKNNSIKPEITSTNVNQKNIIGEIITNNTFISNSYNSLSLKKQKILNIYDRIYTGSMCRYDSVTNFENFNIQNQIEKYQEYEYIKPYQILNQDNILINFTDYLLDLTPDILNVINLSSYFSNQIENKTRVLNNSFKRIVWNISYDDITNNFINTFPETYAKISSEGFILLIDTPAYEDYIFEIKIHSSNVTNPIPFRIKHQYNKKDSIFSAKNVDISPYFKNLETYRFIGQEDFSFKRIVERKIKNDESTLFLLKLNNNYIYTGSKLLNNLSILPYINCIEKNKKYLYDDKVSYEKIIKSILLKSEDIADFNTYKAYTIAKEISVYKNQKNSQEFINTVSNLGALKDLDVVFNLDGSEYDGKSYKEIYQAKYDYFINQGIFPILAAVLAIVAFGNVISELLVWNVTSVGDKRYLNQYFNTKKYGQFIDLIKQRLYTTMTTDTNNIEYVIEQSFINDENGNEITDLQDVRVTRNKSKYLRLTDAGFKIVNSKITSWDGIDFYNRVHIVYHDKNTVEFI